MSNFVYVIQMGDQPLYKVGVSGDPEQRVKQLQTGNPFQLHLVVKIPASSCLTEVALHQKLDDFKTKGEWFQLTHQLLQELITFSMSLYIQALKQAQSKHLAESIKFAHAATEWEAMLAYHNAFMGKSLEEYPGFEHMQELMQETMARISSEVLTKCIQSSGVA